MGLRTWLNNNSAVTTIGAVVLLLVALVVLSWTNGLFGSGSGGVDSYYYDLKTKKLFTADAQKVPPITAPSGANNGVLAHVFSCGDCSAASSRYVGWLEKFTPATKKKLEKTHTFMEINPQTDLIRLPQGKSKWVPSSSMMGSKIITHAHTVKCKQPKTCYP